jgi:hypothetical protein
LNRAMCTAHWMSSGVTDSSSMRTCNTHGSAAEEAVAVSRSYDH